jgi:N-acetyl-alpha-D-glucosaminyl L-malate synthase BshA
MLPGGKRTVSRLNLNKNIISRSVVMKIAMISSEYPPKWGGVGIVAHFLANTCAEKGNEVHVITREHGMKIPKQHENITVHTVPWLKLPLFFTISFGKRAVKKLMELGNDFDIVHVHSNMALLPRHYYEMIKSPVVTTLHGTWWGERSTLTMRNIISPSIGMINDFAILAISPMFDIYEDYAVELSNAVLIGGKSECRDVGARGIKNKYNRVVRLQLGVDVRDFKPENRDDSLKEKYQIGPDEKLLITVGRLAARKGIDVLLESFSKVLKDYSKVKLIIIGEGPQYDKLQAVAKRLNVQNNCRFVSKLSFDELQALYATADLFVFHSLWEGFGLIISEALSSGTPVVSSNMGAVPEMVVFGKSGYYSDVGDTDTQAKYIVKLLKDDVLREKMGKYARKHMLEQFDWNFIVDQTIKLYEEVITDPANQQNKCSVGKPCF